MYLQERRSTVTYMVWDLGTWSCDLKTVDPMSVKFKTTRAAGSFWHSTAPAWSAPTRDRSMHAGSEELLWSGLEQTSFSLPKPEAGGI